MSRPFATESIFRAVADPTRRAILDLLRRGDRPVNEIAQSFRHTRATISAHLRVLRSVGLVRQHRRGRQRVYTLEPRSLRIVAEWSMAYEPYWRRGAVATRTDVAGGSRMKQAS